MLEIDINNAKAAAYTGCYHAFRQFLTAHAQDGDVRCQLLIGLSYPEDNHIDPAVAAKWLERAALQGCGEAYYTLAMSQVLREHWQGGELSQMNGESLLLKSAQCGFTESYHALAVQYATGDWADGVREKNESEAVKWYSLASQSGDADAKYNLATMVLYGEGCAPDIQRGILLLQEASLCRQQQAIAYLKEIYKQGLFGIEVDTALAEIWNKMLSII